MLIGSGKSARSVRRKISKIGGADSVQYPHSLQFYRNPPVGNITLCEFEKFAIDRLKVLKLVESVGLSHTKGSDDYVKKLSAELRKMGMKSFLRTMAVDTESHPDAVYEGRRQDHISHFILRLAYCKSEDLRHWFIQQEVDLFRFRFSQEQGNADGLASFLTQNDLQYTAISEEEKQSLRSELSVASYEMNEAKFEANDFYKVYFTEALDLIRTRKIYLHKGYAYIPSFDLGSLICGCFRMELSKALAQTARMFPVIEEQERLLPMLNHINEWYLGDDYSNRKNRDTDHITADEIDGLCQESFPLCMQQLHKHLRTEHHMKHFGRQQYGLFLKAIGLSLEEAMKFWRTEFMKSMDVDKFDKQYSYNIRHMYGKEGKRVSYTPYSCLKIIQSNPPGAGDYHGCPFRHTTNDLLLQKLKALKISNIQCDAILETVKGGHYQVACAKTYRAVHTLGDNEGPPGIDHPNQYFEMSQNLQHPSREATSKTPQTPTYRNTPMSYSQTGTPDVLSQPFGSGTPLTKKLKPTTEEDWNDEEMDTVLSGIEPMNL